MRASTIFFVWFGCAALLSDCSAVKTEPAQAKGNFADGTVTLSLHPLTLFRIEVAKKWGYIDVAGKIVINPQFDKIGDFTEDGLANVCVGSCDWVGEPGKKTFGGKYGFIDESGKYIVNPQYDNAQDFAYGRAGVFVGKRNLSGDDEGQWGFIDRSGKMVVQPQFGNVYRFWKDHTATVCVGKCTYDDKLQKWGMIDDMGKYIINPQFSEEFAFGIESLAQVTTGTGSDQKIGYIDHSGHMVWNPQN